MRFKQFLNERDGDHRNEISEEQAAELAKQHAAVALSNIKTPIWRGFSGTAPFYLIDTAKGGRKSVNTSNYYTSIMDGVLPSEFPRRSKSIICGNNANKDYADGHSSDISSGGKSTHGMYAILPYDDAKIGICPQHDIWLTTVDIDGDSRPIEDWNRLFERAGIHDFDLDTIVDGIEMTLQDEDDDMFHKFEEIFMPSNVRQQLAKAYTAPFKAATGASFNYTDSRDREVWVGGKALAIREDVLDKFEEDL